MKYRAFKPQRIPFTKRVLPLLLAVLLFPMLFPLHMHGKAYTSGDPSVDSWDVVSDGSSLVVTFSGKAATLQPFAQITYEDGASDMLWITIDTAGNVCEAVLNQPGGVQNLSSAVNGGEDGTYSATVAIPLELLGGRRFDFAFAGASVESSDISGYSPTDPEATPGPEPSAEPSPEPSASPVPTVSPEATATPGPKPLIPNARGRIIVDGDLSDWAEIGGLTSADPKVNEWKLARDTDGNVYFAMDGTAENEPDLFSQREEYALEITQNGRSAYIRMADLEKIPGAETAENNEAKGDVPGPCYIEAMLPASYFTDPDFIITFVKVSRPAGSIPVIDGVELEEEEPVYGGIVIDGKYQDWDAVTKYPANDENLDSAAMVFDGDTVYCYLKENPGMSAAEAGKERSGQYAITADSGDQLVFRLKPGGTVNGVKGAEVKYVGGQWELSIPASELPKYQDTISFGLYGAGGDIVKDVANLNGQGTGGSFNGIVYDGIYTDWDYYPHTNLGADWNGDGAGDSMGALWLSDDTLYGHYATTSPWAVLSLGYCMMSGINFRFSGTEFSVKLIQVSPNGTVINPYPGMVLGKQEFYLIDRSGKVPGYGQNINDMQDNFVCGKITITAAKDKNECEFYLDLKTLGEELGCDFKEIRSRFIHLGEEWITIEGTPTGPWLGVALCVLAVAGVLIFRNRKQAKVIL